MHPRRHQRDEQRSGHHYGEEEVLLGLRVGMDDGLERIPLGGAATNPSGTRMSRSSRRKIPSSFHSVIAMARSAMRSRAESFSVALLSWPQAARMSRPRGVRTGEE